MGEEMQTEDWQDILALLVVVILVDARVYKEEVDTFSKAVVVLNKKISPDIFMTEKMAFDWFVENRERIKTTIAAEDGEARIDGLINRVGTVPKLRDVLRTMFKIARSDSDYHNDERHVIKRASKMWGLPMPRVH